MFALKRGPVRAVSCLRLLAGVMVLLMVAGMARDLAKPYKTTEDLRCRQTVLDLAAKVSDGDRWLFIGDIHDSEVGVELSAGPNVEADLDFGIDVGLDSGFDVDRDPKLRSNPIADANLPRVPNIAKWGGDAARLRFYLIREAQRTGIPLLFGPDPATAVKGAGSMWVFSFRDRLNPYPEKQIDSYLSQLIQRWGEPASVQVIPFATKDSDGQLKHDEALLVYRFD